MKINLRDFQVKQSSGPALANRSAKIKPLYDSKEDFNALLQESRKKLHDLQERMFAHNQYGVLIILHGMDGAGKGGIIEHVIGGINPLGLSVTPFKAPSEAELDHDFLWRHIAHLPKRGEVAVFDRSYYEELVVVRVHPEFIKKQRIPKEHLGKHFWEERFKSIREHEQHLFRNGFRVIKLFLHISAREQARQLIERIDEPDKNFKASIGDFDERKLRKQYDRYWDEALRATSSNDSPWYIIPADDRLNARLIAAKIITKHLAELPAKYPGLARADRALLVGHKAALLLELDKSKSKDKRKSKRALKIKVARPPKSQRARRK